MPKNDEFEISKLNETLSEEFIDTSLKQYIKEITQYKLLTLTEEIEIATKVANGDQNAKEIFINSNLRLVVDIAKHYIGHGLSFLDLIQEGNIGLMKAVDKFDVSKGYKFSTYATWWIRAEITRAIDNQARTIRVPVHMKETITKINHTQEQLNSDLDHEPSKEELASMLNLSKEKLLLAFKSTQNILSLSQPVFQNKDGDSISLENTIADHTAYIELETEKDFLNNEIKNVINKLPNEEKNIIKLWFGIDCKKHTLKEICKILNLTINSVSKIKNDALKILKTMILENQYIINEAEILKRNNQQRTNTKYQIRTPQMLYEEFPEYSIEQILSAINTLNKNTKKILELYYNLNNENIDKIIEELNTMDVRIKDKIFYGKKQIKQRLENNQLEIKTIFDLYPGYTRQEVLDSINSLDFKSKKLIELKFGLNGNKVHDNTEIAKLLNNTPKRISDSISEIRSRKIYKILINNRFENISGYNFKKNKTYIKTLIDSLDNTNEKNILLLRFGMYVSESTIANKLNMNIEDIIKYINSGLANIISMIDETKIKKDKQKNLVKH